MVCKKCEKEIPEAEIKVGNFFRKGPLCRRCYMKKWNRSVASRFIKAYRIASMRELTWTLTMEEFEVLTKKECYYCDGKLGHIEVGIGLDRVDNSLGYTKENVIPCCKKCNTLKLDWLTKEETKAAVEAIIRIRFK